MNDAVPTFRAAVRGGRLTLSPWSPRLLGRGPTARVVRAARAALADLTIHDDDLIVAPLPGAAWPPSADAAIVAWAALVGHRRVWLADRVVDLAGELAPLTRAGVACPTCRTRWDDDAPEFWAMVRRNGHFPPVCMACGGALPEWTADQAPGAVRSGAAVRVPRRDEEWQR